MVGGQLELAAAQAFNKTIASTRTPVCGLQLAVLDGVLPFGHSSLGSRLPPGTDRKKKTEEQDRDSDGNGKGKHLFVPCENRNQAANRHTGGNDRRHLIRAQGNPNRREQAHKTKPGRTLTRAFQDPIHHFSILS